MLHALQAVLCTMLVQHVYCLDSNCQHLLFCKLIGVACLDTAIWDPIGTVSDHGCLPCKLFIHFGGLSDLSSGCVAVYIPDEGLYPELQSRLRTPHPHRPRCSEDPQPEPQTELPPDDSFCVESSREEDPRISEVRKYLAEARYSPALALTYFGST